MAKDSRHLHAVDPLPYVLLLLLFPCRLPRLVPKYLNDHRGFNLLQMGFYASLPLLAGTAGDLMGGWISDIWARRSGNLTLARRGVAVFGFLLAAAAILPATLTTSPTVCVWYTCV